MKSKLLLGLLLALAFTAANSTERAPRDRVQVVYQGAPGNYEIYLFGGRSLRCRAENLHIYRDEQGDGDGPIRIECR